MSVKTMEELKPGMCRWPFGDPKDQDFHFCGYKTDGISTYCDKHMVKAQAPVRKSKAS
ncbi:MAG: GcrA family cell cycle regulator [Bdellovibrionales bacterium]